MNTGELAVWSGVAIAATFWLLTQWNIVKTRRDVSAQVRAATVNLTAHTDKKIGEFTTKVETKLEERFDALPDAPHIPTAAELAAEIELPELEFDEERLAEIIYGKMNAEKAVYQKQLMTQLAELDPELAAIREGLTEELRVPHNATDIALKRFLDHDLPPAFKKRFPDAAVYHEQAKVLTAQFVEMMREARGMMPNMEGAESGSSSGSFNPGFKR